MGFIKELCSNVPVVGQAMGFSSTAVKVYNRTVYQGMKDLLMIQKMHYLQ